MTAVYLNTLATDVMRSCELQGIFGHNRLAYGKVLQIGYVTVLWLAAIAIGRKIHHVVSTSPSRVGNSSSEKPADPALERDKLKLDALKAIRDSSFQRWDKRRGYEWSLSISIWTALAAFSGVVLGKDFPATTNIDTIVSYVAAGGALICLFHGFYLWMMFDHTIGDAYVQRWSEEQMYKVATGQPIGTFTDSYEPLPPSQGPLRKRSFVSICKPTRFYPPLSKYGIVQVLITAVLVLGAIAAVLSRKGIGNSQTPAPTVVINTGQSTIATPAAPAPRSPSSH
jgi:hypothetical protein